MATSFDPRTTWFGWGRTLLALAHVLTLALTGPAYLMPPVIGEGRVPQCGGIRAVSAYCLGGAEIGQEWRRWFMVALLLVVASGYRPRWTVLPHAWIAFSIGVSISLPDGGEAIARIICLLIIPLGLIDDRRWHWQAATTRLRPVPQGIAFAAFLGVRIQLAALYLQSGISKFGVPDWLNGSAEYYILRNPLFGVAGPLKPLLLWMSNSPVIVAGMTWGAIVIEVVIAVFLLSSARWRRIAFLLDIALHAGIIATMGLWSFSLIMIGSAAIAALPDAPPAPAQLPAEPALETPAQVTPRETQLSPAT
ncbi:sporulation-delaying protein SdpB family protein [Kitasatospora sp. NBC_01266]|uniref:sporulation-delaying protein SdpB family protein n=1 Tax=Kitasatospora sp. NBC_01266 TaxID=2903572 RepID=UPI002E30C79D|nr:sporulation-delaying protein SdpB family protein [Kitasatospora sp. NBC_01266]